MIGLREETPETTIQEGALVLDLAGKLVEQPSTPNPADQLMEKWLADKDQPREIAVGDVVYAPQGRWHRASWAGTGMATRIAINPRREGLHSYDPESGQ